MTSSKKCRCLVRSADTGMQTNANFMTIEIILTICVVCHPSIYPYF